MTTVKPPSYEHSTSSKIRSGLKRGRVAKVKLKRRLDMPNYCECCKGWWSGEEMANGKHECDK